MNENNLNNKNQLDVLMLLLLIMQINFLLQDNAIFFSLFEIINRIVSHGLSYDLKYKLDIFLFLW